jgi:hypothetical protein
MGFALPLWVGVLTLTAVWLTWSAERAMSREAGVWLTTAVLFACGAAWRDSEVLQAFDTLAVLLALALAAIALHDESLSLFAARLRDTVWAALSLARTIAMGIIPIALRDAFPADARRDARPTLQPILRAVAITVPLVIIFGSLLLSGDPLFASLAPSINVEKVLTHAFTIGFFAWIVGGWAAGALLGRRSWRAPEGTLFTLGTLDVTVALGTLNVLFGAYVLAQFGWLFGGEELVRARTGLSLATYARTGFFELVWAALLVIPVLVASRVALRPGHDVARRHTVLAMPIIGLVIAMLFSAASRLSLYVNYFGLTTDRFYPGVFMGWLAVVLVWLGVTVLRGWGRPFVAGAAITGLTTLAVLNVANPDVIVARVNLGRAHPAAGDSGKPVDLGYLARLSGDAVERVADATLTAPSAPEGSPARAAADSARCDAATSLVDQWSPSSARAVRAERPASWRHTNAGEVAGLRAIAARSPQLRAVKRATCKPAHR